MAHLTIPIPPEHVDAVRTSVLHSYTVTAEALHAAVNRRLEAADAPEAVDAIAGLRVELSDLDDVLDQLGLAPGTPGEPVALTAHPEVLSDAVHGALDDGIERLRTACTRLWRGSGAAADARIALAAVGERLELLVAVQDG
jgi:hypothetical protein